ncbi:MAG: HEAT repeat domain-containing protein [Planctomycetes bacterium]|nr:HEAT repeat domain-containing protein [Planctomycetota bacterium]
MSLFKKGDSFNDLVEKLKTPARFGPGELAELIAEATSHQEASPRKLAFMMGSSHPRVREAGIRYVMENAPKDAIDVVIQAMAAVDGSARSELARTILQLDHAELLRTANLLFNGSNLSLRTTILEIASLDRDWRDWFGIMKQALRTTDPTLRRAGARLVRRHVQDPTAATVLRELLHDDDDAVRSEAIQGFCDYPTAEIVEPFFARLPHEAPVDQTRMIQALARLSSRPNSNIEQHLFPVLADDDPEARRLAVRLISSMPQPDLVLRKFLINCRGLASWLRERAVRSLLEMANSLCEPLLRLMQDEDEDVRVSAMALAAKINDERVLGPVTKIFCSKADWWIRSLAAEILANFPRDEVLELLLPYLHDPDMRFSIVSALAKMNRPETTAHLLECLKDPARSIRDTALDGLAKRATQEVIEAIVQVTRSDPETSLRAKAVEVLRGYGAPASARLRSLEVELLANEEQEESKKRAASVEGLALEMANPELNKRD